MVPLAILVLLIILLMPVWAFLRTVGINRRLREQEDRIADLKRRLHALESASFRPPEPRPAPPPVPQPEPVREPGPEAQPEPEPPLEQPAAEPPPLPTITPQPAPPRQWIPSWLKSQELEALVGGSLLNVAGALILVIGIALFLGYSFGRTGPLGRVLAGLSISGALLGAGVYLDRAQKYRIFSRGMQGAGWAGLYVTTYAMGAVRAAQLIHNPALATVLLFVVGCAMVAHSLSYRSQVTTGVAYFSAFAALALSDHAQLAVVSLIPLASSLLYLAHRFGWHGMALFGLIATYGTLATRPDSGSPLIAAQVLFLVYWLLFEGFDLLRAHRGEDQPRYTQLVFPLNALFFLAISYVKWSRMAPDRTHLLAAGCALLFLASAIIRTSFRSGGRYEGAITVSAVLGGIAIIDRIPGVWASVALAFEAELLYLAAQRFSRPYLRILGLAVFGFSLFKMLFAASAFRRTPIAGYPVHNLSPVALLHAVLFYFNHYWLPERRHRFLSHAAAALAALVAVLETNGGWRGASLLILAALWIEVGLRRSLPELRLQALGLGALGVAAFAYDPGIGLQKFASYRVWLPLAVSSFVSFGIAARVFHEGRGLREIACAAGSVLAMAASWVLLPDVSVAIAWTALALVLAWWPEFGVHVPAVAAAVFVRLFLANFTNGGQTWLLSHRLLSTGPVIAAFYLLWNRLTWRPLPWFAAAAIVALLRFELGRTFAVAGWAVAAALLCWAARHWSHRDFRWQGHGIAALTMVRCWVTNFNDPESLWGLPSRLLTAGFVIAVFYLGGFSLPATALLALLLYNEVSGGLLTVAWGIEGLLVLGAGFQLRGRVLRLSGLALLLLCVLKLFIHDLRNLDTPYRILSFIALGLILLGVSWVYTRFRERIHQLL